MKHAFHWSNFDIDFMKAVLTSEKTDPAYRALREYESPEEYAPLMEKISKKPSLRFVKKYQEEIIRYVLEKDEHLTLSTFGLPDEKNHHEVIQRISRGNISEPLAYKYVVALGKIGYANENFTISKYVVPQRVDLIKTPSIPIMSLRDYQEDAVEKLRAFFNQSEKSNGIVWVPTGGGKTRIACHFLVTEMISQGYQVVWLAHRDMLLEQGAEQFINMAPMLKTVGTNLKEFQVVCCSIEFASIKKTSKDSNVMLLSIQTAVRNLDYLRAALSKKVVIVCDEAHHGCAPSYEKVFKAIRKKRPATKMIGLTATPFRMTDDSSMHLMEVFDNNIIYKVSMSELIKRKILADPKYIPVKTLIDFEPQLTESDKKYIEQKNDIPPAFLTKMAEYKKRNEIIVNKYLEGNWGPTIVFAMNQVHANTLTDEFTKAKVKCKCVYSGQLGNESVIEEFRRGELDVLVNINILSEGTDLPSTQTVFLTRPTASEGLLLQQIGRGLRGSETPGGTETLNIVDFIDKWEEFNRWINAGNVVLAMKDEINPQEEISEIVDNRKAIHYEMISIPWREILRVYRKFDRNGYTKTTDYINIPVGWYELDNYGETYTILVFEDQVSGFKKILGEKKELIDNPITGAEALRKYFGAACCPPSVNDLQVFLDNIDQDKHLFLIKERNEIDPYKIAEKIEREKLDIFTTTAEVFGKYELVQNLYGDLEEYRSRIFNIINYKDVPVHVKIEELPLEMIDFKIDEPYSDADLQVMFEDVKKAMFENEDLSDLTIEWTENPVNSFFGRYCKLTSNIQINKLMNSSNFSKETVKFVIYHEILHKWNKYHNREFRAREHLYDNYTEYEKELDVNFLHFMY